MKQFARRYSFREDVEDARPNALPDLMMPAMPPLGLVKAIRKRIEARTQRRRLRQLLEYDDRTLEDMGHCRHELVWALRLPRGASTTAALQRCRQQRGVACCQHAAQ